MSERLEKCPLCKGELLYEHGEMRLGECAACNIHVPQYDWDEVLASDTATLAREAAMVITGNIDDARGDGCFPLDVEWLMYIKARMLLARMDDEDAELESESLAWIPAGVQDVTLKVNVRGTVVDIHYRPKNRHAIGPLGGGEIVGPRVSMHRDKGELTLGQSGHDTDLMREALHIARVYFLSKRFSRLGKEE